MALASRGRGVITESEDRQKILSLVQEAEDSGCRRLQACEALNIQERTLQRWDKKALDGRSEKREVPSNKLNSEERALVVKTSVQAEFVNLSPHQIVPRLADQGIYIASESTFYRILKAENLNAHRGLSKPRTVSKPKAYEAVRPNQIYSWDITYLQSVIRGDFFYLYIFLDLFSRKIVGWDIHKTQDSILSADLLRKICIKECINKKELILHADNGGPMKGGTMLSTMQMLGVIPSFSRPSVSDDNPYSESLFKTLKYCPIYPSKPFEDIFEAKKWMNTFEKWYNTEHLHSGINFVTPESKHKGMDLELLKNRDELYKKAKEKNPKRWSGETRNWSPIECVKLNPLKEKIKENIKENRQLAS